MASKKHRFFKWAAISGTLLGSAYVAFGNAVTENMISKKGINAVIERDGLMLPEDSRCFYESEEALKGIAFYKKNVYKKIFTFNKYGTCLHAISYPNPESHIYAISCHGYTGDPSQNNIYARRFYEMGYNVILPYLRGHGKSEHNYTTMGWLERTDIIHWINYIINKDPEAKIILHGVSMGAATVMNATGENLPKNVVCCIEDCGFTSLIELYRLTVKNMFPPIPVNTVLSLINPIFKAKTTINISDNSPIKQVKKSSTPTLFIHGKKDAVVPFNMNNRLYKNAACEKERLILEDATHAAAGYLFPEIYWDAITEFINKHI